MKKWMKNRKTAVCAAAICSIALAMEMPLNVLAAADYAAYEEFRAGSVSVSPANESDYTVIEIATEEDLEALAENCNLDVWSRDKYIKLVNDIALQENTDLCIPSFGGIFDGGGYRITNLQVTGKGSALGLFRYIQENGVVRNLTLEGKVSPEGSQNQVGGIAGVNYGKIINCSFSGYVTGDNDVGGIAGVNEDSGEIRKCQSGAVIAGNHSTGGIVGNNHGILNNCTNTGDVNTHSTEVSYDLEDITMENLEDLNSTSNVAAYTDTGGVAGISDGKIYYCSNEGTVGYSHVGYNVGGIVGRLHQGYLQNCTNTGHILGRKDVGGIAGQMEPFLEVQYLNDKLQELDRETDKFLDLLEATHEDLSNYGGQAADITKSLTTNLKNANSAGGRLLSTANDLWYIYNQELTGINNDLKTLNDELSDQSEADKENGNVHDVTISGNDLINSDNLEDIRNEITNGSNKDDSDEDNNEKENNNTEENDSIKDRFEEWEQKHQDDNNDNSGSQKDNQSEDQDGNQQENKNDTDKNDDASNVTIQVPNDTESYKAALEKFGDNASGHLDKMTSATNDRSGGITNDLNILNSEMESAGNYLEQLADVLETGTDRSSENVDALVEQAKVLRRLISEIRDDLFRYEGITIEDTSDEAASEQIGNPGVSVQETENDEAEDDTLKDVCYDTTSFQQGKITLCINKGFVEADTNVGGIVGQISTEYDLDPEDDITFTGTESFDIEQTVKAVIRDSRNLGTVNSKKDYAGGIVGKADFGAVISCESYGDVSSTNGSYVGGIAGGSGYAVRSCSTMGNLSGKNYVGGIVGKGCDIFYSYAYNNLDVTGECAGSIAGQVIDEGTLYGNYYVTGAVGGIDGIGYESGATPLSYEEFCRLENVPKDFSSFTITFLAEGQELASYQCGYGDSISPQQIPDIPEKEGYYSMWPEFDFDFVTGNKILEAQYEKWVSALESNQTDENGRPYMLVEGEFLPGAELTMDEKGEEISFSVTYPDQEDLTAESVENGVYTGAVSVRVLCEDADKMKIEVEQEGTYTEVQTKIMGSYLVFSMERPGTFRMTKVTDYSTIIGCIAAAAIVVIVVLILLIRKRIAGRKAKRAEREEANV